MKRTTAKAQFTRSEKKLKETIGNMKDVPLSIVQRRLEDLTTRWSIVQEAHDTYAASHESSEEDENQEAWIDEISERFDKLEVQVHQALEEKNASMQETKPMMFSHMADGYATPATTSAAAPISSVQPITNSVQLERIKLDKFNGDIRKYPKFREQFQLYIKPLCSDSQLPFVLRSHLSEQVKEEVDNVDDDLDTLWVRLDKKYGNEGKHVDAILEDIARGPRGDGKSTLIMINTIEKAYRDLERMGCAAEMRNGTIISMIEKKLPDEIRFEWLKLIAEKNDAKADEKFSMLIKLLKRWRNMIEYDQAAIRKPSDRKGISHHTSTTVSNKGVNGNCWIHTNEGHPVWVCKSFKLKSVEDRKALANQFKACLACLSTKCPGSANANICKKKFTCTIQGCNQAHNKLLHQ